jgi:hypothetical protein
MSLLQQLLGNATEVAPDKAQREFADVFEGETIQRAYMLIRDMLAFSDYRIISVDKQGLTGQATESDFHPLQVDQHVHTRECRSS